MRVARLLLFPLFLLLARCAGVFQNPDLVHGVEQSAFNCKISLPPVSDLEHQIYNEFRDTGTVRLPEHDYYDLQDGILNCAMQFSRPDLLPREFTAELGRKDITRVYTMDNPNIDVDAYLKKLAEEGFTVHAVDSCSTELLRAFIKNNIPVLIYGGVTIKKMLRRDADQKREDGDLKNSLTRRLETFDLVYGYQKGIGPSRQLPGEEGDQFIFTTRAALDFKAYQGRVLNGQLLNLFGGAEFANSGWILKDVYIVLPLNREMKDEYAKVVETAVNWGMKNGAPLPRRLY
jgi:hypothetical protein